MHLWKSVAHIHTFKCVYRRTSLAVEARQSFSFGNQFSRRIPPLLCNVEALSRRKVAVRPDSIAGMLAPECRVILANLLGPQSRAVMGGEITRLCHRRREVTRKITSPTPVSRRAESFSQLKPSRRLRSTSMSRFALDNSRTIHQRH